MPYPPATTLYVNGYTIEHAATASPGSRIVLGTVWEDSCSRRSTPLLAGSYEGGGNTTSYPCDPVRYRVRVRCLEHCKIHAVLGETTDDALEWGPTRDEALFVVEPLADSLQLEATFEHGRDRRVARPPSIRIARPNDIVVECGGDSGWVPCAGGITSDPRQNLRVRDGSGISLGDVSIGGQVAALGYAPITRVVVTGPDGRLVPGHYPVTIQVGRGPRGIRRELVLDVRP